MVGEGEAAAIGAVAAVAAAEPAGKGPVGQRQPADGPAPAGRAGPTEAQRELARRELGGLLAADQPARAAARSGSRLPQRRAADAGHQHPRAERRGGPGADRAGLGRRRGATDSTRAAAPRWARHRLVFWPRTTRAAGADHQSPRPRPAVYGKIRVLAGWEHSAAGRLPASIRPVSARPRASAGGLPRPAAVPRELLRRRVARRLERPEPGRLEDLLRRRHAAGRVPAATSATTA